MSDGLFLGGEIEPTSGERTADEVRLEPSDLTTHGVIVGMTGSGKTGLGVVLLEELLTKNIPVLVIDPKGDMGNLKLRFPDQSAAEFRPWIDETAVARDGGDADAVAAKTAQMWKSGLAGWNLGADDLRRLDAVPTTIYTPGSSAGQSINVIGSLAPPAGIDWEDGAESVRAEIEGYVSGLLGLIDIDADPLSSREHILLANLIERAWRSNEALDLARLIGQVQAPPLRKLGVFELDTFFPPKDRTALAMRLNGLVANPSFGQWMAGESLDISRLLFTDDGRAKASVFYLAHCSESERQFVVTLLLSKVATWMQTQPGTGDLRAVVYMDEVFGFVPPTASPPSKKPILTLLKQARAFGVGLVLSTQNPVDLDYKAMSNAGTWMIGRLQTERDKARILEALQSARGDGDTKALDRLLSGLGKRQFLLHSTRASEPTVFTTRWAMSYLAGPLTKPQIRELEKDTTSVESAASSSPASAASAASAPITASTRTEETAAPSLEQDETLVPPTVADDIAVRYLDPAAPWADEVDAVVGGTRLEAGICARINLLFDDKKLDLEHREEVELVVFPLDEEPDVTAARMVDYDKRDLRREPIEGARYVLPPAPIHTKKLFARVSKDLRAWLLEERHIELWLNRKLKLASRPGESEEAFRGRCEKAAGELADREAAKMREKLEKKLKTIERREATATRQREKARVSASASKTTEVVSGVGSVLGVLLGGKSSARAIARRAARQAKSAASRRASSSRARSRLVAADDRLAELADDRDELESQALTALSEIDDEYSEMADDIETVEVGLERRDIEVESLSLVWIPTE